MEDFKRQLEELDTWQIVAALAAAGWRGTIFYGEKPFTLTDETQPTGKAPTTE